MEQQYTKLSELVDSEFTVETVWGYKWKLWDNANKKMLVSDTYEKGYRKVYQLDTDKGKLDLGAGQIGNLLEAVMTQGVSDLNGRTFAVKSNGKSGMDIRYYFNPTKKKEPVPSVSGDEDVDLNDLFPEDRE